MIRELSHRPGQFGDHGLCPPSDRSKDFGSRNALNTCRRAPRLQCGRGRADTGPATWRYRDDESNSQAARAFTSDGDPSTRWAGGWAIDRSDKAEPFPVAELFFELNDTDGDLGIHADIDGGPWTSLEIEGPGERKLLHIVSKSRLRLQGLTQLAFESAEPSFDELDPADFFLRFPEGNYEIEARRQGGGAFESTSTSLTFSRHRRVTSGSTVSPQQKTATQTPCPRSTPLCSLTGIR